MGVGQPAVERPERQFNRKRDEEEPENERGRNHEVGPRNKLRDSGDAQFWNRDHRQRIHTRSDVYGEYGHQHERTARQCEQHELHRRVTGAATAPDRDQHVHRDQLELEEDEEQEQIERHEHAEHCCFQQQQPQEILADARLDPPRCKRRRHAEYPGQQHQRSTQAVHAQDVRRPEGVNRNPALKVIDHLDLVGAVTAVVTGEYHHGKHESDDRRTNRDPANLPVSIFAAREHCDQHRHSGGQEHSDRQQPIKHGSTLIQLPGLPGRIRFCLS